MNDILAESENTPVVQGLSRLSFQSLAQAAAQQLRERILEGRIKPGERLVEQKLARELGIGQPTVREALKELEYQGFVRKTPNKGTYVTRLEKEDLSKILEVRISLEALAIRRAVRKITDAEEQEMEEVLKAMESAAEQLDLAAFHKNDLAFHQRMWDLSGNQYVGMVLERVVFSLFAFGLMPRQDVDVNEFLASVETHRQILEGLRSGDPDRACEIFVEAISQDWKKYFQIEIDHSVIPTTPLVRSRQPVSKARAHRPPETE